MGNKITPLNILVKKNPVRKDWSSHTFFQPKLTINQPNDVYEQEADAVSEKVMRKESPNLKDYFFSPVNSSPVLRKCDSCDEEDKNIQRKENSNVPEATESVNKTLNRIGQKMDSGTLQFMENRFGHDFGSVQVHHDEEANHSAKSINALAYTQGNHIVFGKGQYQPDSDKGKKLLAHELTHFKQQEDEKSLGSIRRYSIEGPWDKGDPIHENITLYALIISGIIPKGTKFTSDDVWEFMRGSIWNDDPEGLLFDNNENKNKNWSSDMMWYSHFKDGKKNQQKWDT